jgi:hypothetical protein
MSELAIRDRLMDIYSQQAAMGMGCMNEYIQPINEGDGSYQDLLGDGEGLIVGGARKRPPTKYNIFVKKFIRQYGHKYKSNKTALKAAAAAWRKCKKSSTKSRKIGKVRVSCAPKRRKRSVGKGPLNEDYDFEFGGMPVGGLSIAGAGRTKRTKLKRSNLPTAAQLRALGVSASDFAKLKEMTRNNSRGFTVPKYTTQQLARMGNRFGTRYLSADGKKRCRGINSKGPFFLDTDYSCNDYVAPLPEDLSLPNDPIVSQMDSAYKKARNSLIKQINESKKQTKADISSEYDDMFTQMTETLYQNAQKKKNIGVI